MSRPAIAFRPALLTGSDADYDAQNRNNRDLARAIERLQLPGAVVAAVVSTPSRRFIAPELTGASPWSWTGLNGDATGLRGYEIVGRTSGATAASIGLQFNGDTGANYGDAGGAAQTKAKVAVNGGGEVVTTVINIPIAKSGVPRVMTVHSPRSDAVPEIFSFTPAAFVWNSTAVINRIDLIEYAGGPVDAATWALYALMDVE